MQYLAVFLLVGLGLASAYTSDFDGLSSDRFESVDQLQAGGWITDRMREALEKMVEGFEKAMEEGHKISKQALEKAEELYQKLLDWGIDVGEKIRDALERIREDFDKNRPDQADMHAGGWITDRMREALEKMVEGFEKAMEEGHKVSKEAFKKAEELYNKLLDWGIDVGEKIRDALERIREDFEKNRPDQADMHAGGWITDRMREALEKMVEGFEKAMEEGHKISKQALEKAEELYQKLLDWGIDVGEKIRDALERIREDFDKNRPDQADMHAGGWIADRMRETFEKMIEGFEKAIERGQVIGEDAFRKAEEIYHKLLDWGVDLGEKVKEAFERISKDFEKNRPDRADMHAGGWIADRMRETFEKMIEGFEKAIERGQVIGEDAFRKAEELYHKLLDWGVDLGEKVKEAFERISKDFENKSQRGPISDRLKEAFENMVRKMKEAVDSGSGVRGDLMKKAEDMYEKLKSLKVEISDEVRTIFEDMKSKFGRHSVQHGIILDRLREAFERIVERIKERSDGGSGISGRLMQRAEAIYEMLKNLRIEVSEKIRGIFEDLRSKMGRNSVQRGPMIDRLKEAFENVVNKIKDAFENGKGVRGDLMKKAEDIYEKLKNLKVEISDKIKSIFEDLRSKMGRSGPTSQDANISNIFDLLRRLKKFIKEKLDSEKLKEKVEELFGKGSEISEQILEMLRTKGEKAKQKILDWIDRILPDKEERSISEVYEKLREFFKDLQLDLKERFTKFGEWVKEKYEKGLEKGKDKAENIKRIAKEFLEDTRVIGKDMAEEALGFFREYKKDLGKLYDNVVDKIGKILKS